MTGETPEYVCELIPEQLGKLMPSSRHGNNSSLLRASIEMFRIRLWNELLLKDRSLEFVKKITRGKSNDLYCIGVRYINI